MVEWLMAQKAAWALLIFPLLIGIATLGAIADQRKWNAKVRNPYTMTNREYEQHNQRRFSG